MNEAGIPSPATSTFLFSSSPVRFRVLQPIITTSGQLSPKEDLLYFLLVLLILSSSCGYSQYSLPLLMAFRCPSTCFRGGIRLLKETFVLRCHFVSIYKPILIVLKLARIKTI